MSTRYIHSGAQVIATLDLPAVPSQAAVTGAESNLESRTGTHFHKF